MNPSSPSRRGFFKLTGTALAAGLLNPYVFTADAEDRQKPRAKNDRFRIGAIGMRYQGSVITEKALAEGDLVAIADVDRQVAEKAREQFGGKAELYENYRSMLDRSDLDVILIGAPDHWHTAMVIDACRSGRDVYCEKPLTLTIDEGKLLTKEVGRSGRVVQVGSWQRSDQRFRLACEMVRAGRIGRVKKVSVVLGKNATGGPFPSEPPPPHLNWNLWQGQTPEVPYIKERSHYTFRWWREYSGGQTTDWGAHHVDIAQWAIGMHGSGPVEIEGRATYPEVADCYNVPTSFAARLRYADGVEMEILDEGRNGVLFEGEGGHIFVNRNTLAGGPVDQLVERPLRARTSRSIRTTISPGLRARASWTRSSITWATSSTASGRAGHRCQTSPASIARPASATWPISRCVWRASCVGIPTRSRSLATTRPMAI